MKYIFWAFLTILAVFAGGFLGRLSYALPRGDAREIWDPACPFCGRRYGFRFNLPIFGILLFRARCPHCGESAAPRAFFSEILFGASALLLLISYDLSPIFFAYLGVSALLLMLSLIDLDIKEVPHSILLAILLFGALFFVFSFTEYSLTSVRWWEHLIGAIAISLPLFLVMMATGGGVGGGDVKLMFCLGFLLGYKAIVVTFLAGIVFAALYSLFMIVKYGKSGRFQVPLVPFLSLGFLFAVTYGLYLEELLFFATV